MPPQKILGVLGILRSFLTYFGVNLRSKVGFHFMQNLADFVGRLNCAGPSGNIRGFTYAKILQMESKLSIIGFWYIILTKGPAAL